MNFTLSGKVSIFGGPDDKGMTLDSGLSLYEPQEADLRPELFLPEDAAWLSQHPAWVSKYPGQRQPTWARLRADALYFAVRFPHILMPARDTNLTWEGWHSGFYRSLLQSKEFAFARSPAPFDALYGCRLVDFGPHLSTRRMFDISPGLAGALGVETDDEVTLEIP